jgi:hypothetical protein
MLQSMHDIWMASSYGHATFGRIWSVNDYTALLHSMQLPTSRALLQSMPPPPRRGNPTHCHRARR